MKYQTEKGILLEEYDEVAENPRTFSDHYTTFYTFSNRHSSPDEHSYKDFASWLFDMLPVGAAKALDEEARENHGLNTSHLISEFYKRGIVLLPVYKYEHSGIVYRAVKSNPFSCPFDSGIIGVIYARKQDIHKEYGKRLCKSILETVHNLMIAEVDEYSAWADGNVYCYCLEGEDEWVGGFYGDISENGAKEHFGVSEATPIY